MSPATWVEQFFPIEADRPDPRTVRRWVEDGAIPGRIIGRRIYVDAAAWAAQENVVAKKTEKRPSKGSVYRL